MPSFPCSFFRNPKMVGYVEDLELISVSDILNNVSISLVSCTLISCVSVRLKVRDVNVSFLKFSPQSPAEHERFLNATSSTSVAGNRTMIESKYENHDLQFFFVQVSKFDLIFSRSTIYRHETSKHTGKC